MPDAPQRPLIFIHDARASEVDALLALRRRVFAEARWFVTEADEHREDRASLARLIAQSARANNGFMLSASVHDHVVGMLLLQGESLRRIRHVARLEIMVDADARGQGVGAALMEACIWRAERLPGLRKISLAVFADNHRAIHLYEQFGFQIEGRRVQEYQIDGEWIDDLLMYRRIGGAGEAAPR